MSLDPTGFKLSIAKSKAYLSAGKYATVIYVLTRLRDFYMSGGITFSDTDIAFVAGFVIICFSIFKSYLKHRHPQVLQEINDIVEDSGISDSNQDTPKGNE